MPFDLSTATPVEDFDTGGFDLSTAKPEGRKTPLQMMPEPKKPTTWERFLSAGIKGAMPGGLTPGGIVPAVVGMAGEASNIGQEMLEGGAYKAGGAVTDIAAKGLPPELAAALGYATNVGIQSAPMFIGGSLAKPASSFIESRGKQLMSSALKPSKAEQATGKAARAVQTMLDKGINVTPGGVEKLRNQIDSLNSEIQQAISSSTSTVDKKAVASRVKDVIDQFKNQVTPQSDLKTIKRAWNDFMTNPLIKNTANIPVQLAQKMKQGTYRSIGSKAYGELKGADVETQKALARGLKEEIAKVVPDIDKLNKKESELLNAEAIAASRVLMDMNKNPMGLGWLAMHPATWLGFAADRSPLIKSLLARATYGGAKVIPQTAGQVAGAGVGSLYMGKPNQ